jgi:hypothetical protein
MPTYFQEQKCRLKKRRLFCDQQHPATPYTYQLLIVNHYSHQPPLTIWMMIPSATTNIATSSVAPMPICDNRNDNHGEAANFSQQIPGILMNARANTRFSVVAKFALIHTTTISTKSMKHISFCYRVVETQYQIS